LYVFFCFLSTRYAFFLPVRQEFMFWFGHALFVICVSAAVSVGSKP
jgi:hypothetical protein